MSGTSAGAVEEIDRLRAAFERLARTDCARSPLSAEICLAVAGSETTLALVMRAPAHQRRPTLLLAAIHDLLLAGAQHALAAHYPTLSGGRRANGRPGDLALDFCAEYEQRLAGILARRSTQTNEVNRVAALLPALAHSTPPGATLRLVELGLAPASTCSPTTATYATGPPRAGCKRAPGPTSPTASPGCAPRSRSRSGTRRRHGARTARRLADAHPHVHHMRWRTSWQREAQDLLDR